MLIIYRTTVQSFNPLYLKIYTLKPLRIILALSGEQATPNCITNEFGFCLKERCKRQWLIQFRKIVNNACPDCLWDLLPRLASITSPYHRCEPYERPIPPVGTELYRHSFFPSIVLLWNNLPASIQESPFLNEIKRSLPWIITMFLVIIILVKWPNKLSVADYVSKWMT